MLSACCRPMCGRDSNFNAMRPDDRPPRFFSLRRALAAVALGLVFVGRAVAAPAVEFQFEPPAGKENPFQRDLWAEVTTPSGAVLHLPAYFVGGKRYAVRARATETGEYRLGAVTEQKAGAAQSVALETKRVDGGVRKVTATEQLPQVMKSSGRPAQLRLADGRPYTPVGTNLAWAPGGGTKYYERAFPLFHQQGLNWMRVWMAHWSGMNLDWFPTEKGASPPIGTLDSQVAERWDEMVAMADENGVYLQLVLQHHGQYSTTVNPNWPQNPWNAAHAGGFLKTPSAFFTDAKARELTRWKYRYIIARWGYSPAIVAWELFNEVHWVDALKLDHNDAAVAAWHTEMAQEIRRLDPYHHLVTTSTEDLFSPIYAAMDYFQPHLYPADVIAGSRTFMRAPSELDRPVFYGEMGDDHLALTPEQKKSGVSIVPSMWASLMGQGRLPAQPWLGADLIEQSRLGELGAVARFVAGSQIDRQANLAPFSAVIESENRQPLVIEGVQRWQRRAAPELDLPLDGRRPVELADVPQVYTGTPSSRAAGYVDHATFHLDAPRDLEAGAIVSGMAERGAVIRISIDGRAAAEKSWATTAPDAPSATHPAEVPFRISAGKHTLVVENPGGADWFELSRLTFDLDVPVLAAIGQRSEDFIALWIWHQANVYSLGATPPANGSVMIESVPAGRWQIVWWDSFKGEAASPIVVDHAGGMLKLSTPPISRHAAVVLTRL